MIPRYTLPAMARPVDRAGPLRGDAARRARRAARARAQRGVVPPEAVDAIAATRPGRRGAHRELERTTDHDVIAFVSQVAETVGAEGRWLHYGLTSSDVVDTALALQCRAAA